jgi:hypothetical protein
MTDDKESLEDSYVINDDCTDQLTNWISKIDSNKPRNKNEVERLKIDLEDETKKIAELTEKRGIKKRK